MNRQNGRTDPSEAPAHGLTRRRFLGVAGAGLAGTVLAASCTSNSQRPTTMSHASTQDTPRYAGPIFDGHMHYSQAHLDEILVSLAEGGIEGGINLWGGDLSFGYQYHGAFDEMLRIVRQKKMNSFVQFYWPVWADYLTDGAKFVENLTRDMKRYADLGCKGLKVWKDFGMYFMRADGTPVTMDDPGLEPVWRTAAELGWTIALHQADPSKNWLPGARYQPKTTLTREQIYRARDRVVEAHPEIHFILCHAGNYVESLPRFGEYLDRYRHVNSDLAAAWENWGTEAELWAFLANYADRLYEGTDLMMLEGRPPDRVWNAQFVWRPHREKLARWERHVGREVVQKIAWGNGTRDFVKAT
jgi:hypothetical protein